MQGALHIINGAGATEALHVPWCRQQLPDVRSTSSNPNRPANHRARLGSPAHLRYHIINEPVLVPNPQRLVLFFVL